MCTTRWAPRYWCNWWNPEDAEYLKNRGIIYSPDFTINAGNAIYLVSTESMGCTEKKASEETYKIGDTLKQIYSAADELGINTRQAVERIAKNRIRTAGQKDS